MNVAKYIKDSFNRGTQISRFNIIAAALLGAPAHFSFYFVFKYFDQPWESLPVRLVAVMLCLGALFKLKKPDFLGKYFPLYWHAMLIYVLPFIITVFLLKNNFHELWLYWEIFMIFILISFVSDWLMFLIDLTIGVAAAIVFYLLTTPVVELDPQFNIPLYSIVVVFSIVAGYMFSLSNRKGLVAQEKNSALEALARSIAHEMRNPLGQVKLCFESILQELPIYHQDKIAELISAKGLDRIYLRVAQGQMAVSRGTQVINMILDEVKNKPIDIRDFYYLSAEGITRKALDEYSYENEAEREHISFECKDDFLIKADETMYVFVLFNLIMNAFYFIKPYPDARIYVRFEKGDKFNKVYVKDTGPGIPAENLSKLFDAFFTSGRKGGTGLGLAYCKRVMKAFGGDIECNSVHGKYTEFALSFPVIGEQELAEFRKSMVEDHLEAFQDKRILLVDDEVQDRVPVKNYLKPFRVIIDEAGNGKEALEMLKKNHYDIILMNLNMPVMNGFEAARAIRNGEAGILSKNIPIIGHTAVPTYVARGKTEKVGMQGFISKPVAEPELINLLARNLNDKGLVSSNDHDSSRITVMLVDDSSFNRIALRGILEKFNIRSIEAVNGNGALEKLRNNGHDCDLILMDVQMPGLNGFETTRCIRQEGFVGNSDIPIIGISGDSDEEELMEAHEAGMDDFLCKPVDTRLLISKIRHLVKSRK